MSENGSDPFKLGALDPMLGDETGSECGGADECPAGPVPALWPSMLDHCGVQGHVPDSVIDPGLLQQQSQEWHASATEAGVSISAEINPYSLNET